MTSRFRRATAAGLIGLLATLTARAEEADTPYRNCDGYGAATATSDGLTGLDEVTLFTVGHHVQYTPNFDKAKGPIGVAACDAALALLPQQYWMRRVSLLRAKALHRLQAGDAAGALADLDLAKSASTEDTFYARSLGLGLQMTRGLALRMIGKQAEAEAVILAALRTRPYNRQVAGAAEIALGPAATPASQLEATQALGRLFSEEIDLAYVATFNAFRFADVVDMHSQLPATLTTGGSPVYRASRGGMYAYALAALGRGGEARAAIETIRQGLAMPPPAHPADESDTGTETENQGHRSPSPTAMDPEAPRELESWASLVEKRILVTEGKYAEVIKLNADHTAESWADVELIEALRTTAPPALSAKLPRLDTLRARLAKATDTTGTDADALYVAMPAAETADILPRYQAVGSGLFSGNDGYSIVKVGDNVGTTIAFRSAGTHGTPAMVEEMALLRAAQVARIEGKKGLVIVTRIDHSYYKNPGTGDKAIQVAPDGFYSRLTVAFVDPDALPDAYKGNAWRVFDVDAIIAQLAPIYISGKK